MCWGDKGGSVNIEHIFSHFSSVSGVVLSNVIVCCNNPYYALTLI